LRRRVEEGPPPRPTEVVPGLDAAIERAILRCLELEPRDRPATALAVSAALPGGDPLAAALAAGETPSPEMVAAAGGVGALSPGVALAGAVAVLASLAVVVLLSARTQAIRYAPATRAPELLADQAH